VSCTQPGSTHHLACDCREAEWAAKLAAAEARIRSLEADAAIREAEVQAHMEARYAAEAALRSIEDAIRVPGDPGRSSSPCAGLSRATSPVAKPRREPPRADR
jgi:hypothetical protein